MQAFKALVTYCINRNILECKDFPVTNAQAANVVLIETYWNVKTDVPSVLPDAARVLIETYWNVKTESGSAPAVSCLRINRNILECKVKWA